MISLKARTAFHQFWLQFTREPLYECVFGDAAEWSGLSSVDTWERVGNARTADVTADMCAALGYGKGFADAARLACEFMTPRWETANLIGIAAGIQLAAVREGSITDKRAWDLCEQWSRELRALAATIKAA